METHPQPVSRIWNLYKNTEHGLKDIDAKYIEGIIKEMEQYKFFIDEVVKCDNNTFKGYGSIYLGQWRGKSLVDRVDY